jgi:hypothetical protein
MYSVECSKDIRGLLVSLVVDFGSVKHRYPQRNAEKRRETQRSTEKYKEAQ